MQTARHEQHYKILKLYDAPADYRRLKQKVVDTVVSVQNDNRFFAKTKVDGEEILALLGGGHCGERAK